MFAQCDIKRGELILAERPLLVVSSIPTFAQFLQPNISDRDAFLQPCFDWLTPDNQAAYRALANSHIRMVVAHFTVSFELTASASRMEKWRRISVGPCTRRFPESTTGAGLVYPVPLLTYKAAVDRMHLISLRFRLSPANCEPCLRSRKTMKYLLRTVPYLNQPRERQASSSAPVLLALFPCSTIYTRTLVNVLCIFQSPSMNGSLPKDHLIKPALTCSR
jgi:hypothetical protein